MSTAAQVKFLQWAKREQPEFFELVREKYDGESGRELGFDFGSLFQTAVSAYGDYQANKLKKHELKINLERARQGQDPVDFRNIPQQSGAVYTQGSVPVDANKMALYGLIAVGLVVGAVVFMRKSK